MFFLTFAILLNKWKYFKTLRQHLTLTVLTDCAGLEVVDRGRQQCDKEPAAGATMTSSMMSSQDHSDARREEDACKAGGCADNTATGATAAAGMSSPIVLLVQHCRFKSQSFIRFQTSGVLSLKNRQVKKLQISDRTLTDSVAKF